MSGRHRYPFVMSAPLAVAAILGTAAIVSRVRAGRRGGVAITKHTVPWRGAGRKVRVVHLTDIHAGATTPRWALERVAEIVMEQRGDLVVMTGDYVNMSLSHLSRVTELVELLPGPVVATLGNHDHWTNANRVTRALENGGARVLRNESMVATGDGWSLPIVGVDDGRSGHADVPRAFERVEEPEQALVLSHYPSTAEQIAKTGARLVLSGHTHAGQVDVPHLTKALARLIGNPYLHGSYRLDRTELYVSAGIGHSLEGLRAGKTCPEIAVFDLDPDAGFRRSRTERVALRN